MYQVEQNIPVPSPAPVGRKRIYPFKSMKVGDSFFVPLGDGGHLTASGHLTAKRVRASASNAFGKGGSVVRVVDGGLRVWRIK